MTVFGGERRVPGRTGSGKTEAAWLWACRQTATMCAAGQGVPRVFYTLPYLASINANADRTTRELGSADQVGVAHGRAAAYHLANAGCPEDGDAERVTAARKAVARQAGSHPTVQGDSQDHHSLPQLPRAALVGAAHSSLLVDAANSAFIMDELHAYDTKRLGYILAMMRLLEQLGGRFAVLSATLPDALAELIEDTFAGTVPRTDDADSHQPARHRIRTRPHHLTDPCRHGHRSRADRGGLHRKAAFVTGAGSGIGRTAVEGPPPCLPATTGGEATWDAPRMPATPASRCRTRTGTGSPSPRTSTSRRCSVPPTSSPNAAKKASPA